MRYWPLSSVVTESAFSIRAGLAASTVKHGSTTPDASLATPVMTAWADAVAGRNRRTSRTRGTAADRWVHFRIATTSSHGGHLGRVREPGLGSPGIRLLQRPPGKGLPSGAGAADSSWVAQY